MKNAIFIHAANMNNDVWGRPNTGNCQRIIDRISYFLEDSKIYEDVESITIINIGTPGIQCNIPKSKIIYHGPNLQEYEMATLIYLKEYCKNNPDNNVLYLHDHGVSLGFNHREGDRITQMYRDRLDYHLYWNVTKYKESLKYLVDYDTCGAFLVPLNAEVKLEKDNKPHIISLPETPIWHYSNNFWWATAKHTDRSY